MSTDHQPDQDAFVHAGLTIAAAADRLGVSENAVRQRIKRGTLDAAKVDGVWRVALPDREDDQQDGYQGRPSGDPRADQEATGRSVVIPEAARAQLAAIRDEFVAPLVATIGALERELGRLEAERDQATRERDELRAENERLRNAAVARPEAPAATEPAEPAFRPSVAAWRERTTRAVDLDQPSEPVPWWWRWWRGIKGE